MSFINTLKEKKARENLVKILEDVLEFMKVQDWINKALDTKLNILNRRIELLLDKKYSDDNNE